MTSPVLSSVSQGGIASVEALIPVATEAQIIRFANYLRNFFVTCESKEGLRAASLTLGRLASTTEIGIPLYIYIYHNVCLSYDAMLSWDRSLLSSLFP
jgi:hypothetical protein